MTASAMWDSSMFSLTRPSHQSRTIAPRLEGESKATKEVPKEKSKRSSKEFDKKFHEVKVNEKKVEPHEGLDINGLSEKAEDIEPKHLLDGHDTKRPSKEFDKKFHEVKVNEKKVEPHEGLDINGLSEKVEDIEPKHLLDGHDTKRPSVSLALRYGRRRSFCGSQVELADIFASSGVKMVAVDMPPFMQIHVADCARKAYDSLEKFTSKTLACTIKKEFDGVYGPAWHCIVGTSFGSFVTHSVGGFMYFSMDQKLYSLLFKTTVERAD